jgi:hypothetical protein
MNSSSIKYLKSYLFTLHCNILVECNETSIIGLYFL